MEVAMFTTRQIAAIAVFLAVTFSLLTGRPEGDASIAPPALPGPSIRDHATGDPGDRARAEAVFAARYEAAFERGLYPGLPVTVCEAKLQECRGLSYAACRENCREACGLK
jgi:hypothetical protein